MQRPPRCYECSWEKLVVWRKNGSVEGFHVLDLIRRGWLIGVVFTLLPAVNLLLLLFLTLLFSLTFFECLRSTTGQWKSPNNKGPMENDKGVLLKSRPSSPGTYEIF
jgi:hypothetical protein